MDGITIPLFLNAGALQECERETILWSPSAAPHALVFGATGSGKTYAVKLMLGKIATYAPGAKAVICDYKADDFRFLAGTSRYYDFDRCVEGLNSFYNAFQTRQSGGNPSRSFRLLMFDEWAAFVSMLDKKEAEDAKRKLATLLMLGRSFNYYILISQQRADAAYFATARDNFNLVLGLGNLSKESRDMFFAGYKEELAPVRRQGEGYMLTNGTGLQHIQVPTVRDGKKLDDAIRRLVT